MKKEKTIRRRIAETERITGRKIGLFSKAMMYLFEGIYLIGKPLETLAKKAHEANLKDKMEIEKKIRQLYIAEALRHVDRSKFSDERSYRSAVGIKAKNIRDDDENFKEWLKDEREKIGNPSTLIGAMFDGLASLFWIKKIFK